MRAAACILSKDALVAGCGDALLDLEQAVARAMAQETGSEEVKAICAAVLQAMGSAHVQR